MTQRAFGWRWLTVMASLAFLFLIGVVMWRVGPRSIRPSGDELLAQEIEAKSNLKVERRFYLAGSYICQQALVSGRIDLYPEYTGTALTAVLKQMGSVSAGARKAIGERVNELKREVEAAFEEHLGAIARAR